MHLRVTYSRVELWCLFALIPAVCTCKLWHWRMARPKGQGHQRSSTVTRLWLNKHTYSVGRTTLSKLIAWLTPCNLTLRVDLVLRNVGAGRCVTWERDSKTIKYLLRVSVGEVIDMRLTMAATIFSLSSAKRADMNFRQSFALIQVLVVVWWLISFF